MLNFDGEKGILKIKSPDGAEHAFDLHVVVKSAKATLGNNNYNIAPERMTLSAESEHYILKLVLGNLGGNQQGEKEDFARIQGKILIKVK